MNSNDFEKCVIYKRCSGHCVISCKFGKWSVTGGYNLQLIKEAEALFKQHRAAGQYNNILGKQKS